MEPPGGDPEEDRMILSPAMAPICAALFPHLVDGSESSVEEAKARNKCSVPPIPLAILQDFERWLAGSPAPPELEELGSAPPPAEDE